jgi:DNA invertase Pin-like site-specific DNA recombinase
MEWEARTPSLSITITLLPTPILSRFHKPSKAIQQYWIGYCRKSTDDPKKQQMSLPDQDRAIREYYDRLPAAEKEGRPLRILPHEKVSAFRPGKRPVFQQMMQMVDRGEIFGILAAQSNRISRNREESGQFEQRLVDGRITYFDAVVDGRRYTGEKSNDIFMLGVEGNMSWKDSKDKGTLILQRMEARAAEGNHMGRKPFAFLKHVEVLPDGTEIRKTVLDKTRLPHLVALFKNAASGAFSLSDLARWAEATGVQTKPSRKNPTGKLSVTTIAHILHDPYYKGYVRFNGKMYQWTKDPPISEDLWNRVQFALLERCTNTSRVKVDSLRRRFVYGSAIDCGTCGGTLSPYKVRKKNGTVYVYYECKSRKKLCKVIIPQEKLTTQYNAIVQSIQLSNEELNRIRDLLLQLHKKKSSDRLERREMLHHDYQKVEREISDQVSCLKRAQELGVEREAEANILQLRSQRDRIQKDLNDMHDEGSAWIEKTIQSFELLKMTEEALKYGSPQIREAVLKAIASNYSVIDGKLVCDLRSPFKEAFQKEGRSEWWTISDSNRGPFECESNALTS